MEIQSDSGQISQNLLADSVEKVCNITLGPLLLAGRVGSIVALQKAAPDCQLKRGSLLNVPQY
jgi:hypothetical protein